MRFICCYVINRTCECFALAKYRKIQYRAVSSDGKVYSIANVVIVVATISTIIVLVLEICHGAHTTYAETTFYYC